MARLQVTAMLEGSDRRSIGRSNEVVEVTLKNPRLFRELIACLWNENPLIRMRAADVAEKVSARRPELLQRYKPQLLGFLAETEQIELRWHVAAMIPRLQLTPGERRRAFAGLQRYLDDRSSIVKTFALQALFDLAQNESASRESVRQLLEAALQTGTPAMKARARHLLKKLQP